MSPPDLDSFKRLFNCGLDPSLTRGPILQSFYCSKLQICKRGITFLSAISRTLHDATKRDTNTIGHIGISTFLTGKNVIKVPLQVIKILQKIVLSGPTVYGNKVLWDWPLVTRRHAFQWMDLKESFKFLFHVHKFVVADVENYSNYFPSLSFSDISKQNAQVYACLLCPLNVFKSSNQHLLFWAVLKFGCHNGEKGCFK